MNRQKNLTGFTILETLFSVAIFSLLFGVIFQCFSVSNNNWSDMELKVQMREQTERAIDTIFTELRAADRTTVQVMNNVNAGASTSGYFVPADALERGDGRTYALGFQLPVDGGSGMTITTGGQINHENRILYFLNDSSQLVKATVSSTGEISRQVLARNVSFFEVLGYSTIGYSATGAFTGGTPTASGPSRVDLRINFQNTSLSKRLVLDGYDPTTTDLSDADNPSKRGGGTQVVLRNLPGQ